MSETLELLICVTCRLLDAPADPDRPRPGRVLADALQGRMPAGVTLIETECLSNCKRGCTIALRGPGRWTYVYGDIDPAQAPIIAEGAQKFRDAPQGLVPWRDRPEHFRKHCIARIPPLVPPLEAP